MDSAVGRLDHIEATMVSIAETKNRWRKRFLVLGTVLVVVIVGLTWQIRENRQAAQRNAAAIERVNDIRISEARRACERGNNSIEVDKFQINKMYDLVLIGPQNQTPERQQILSNLRAQELRQLEELRPVRDCTKIR